MNTRRTRGRGLIPIAIVAVTLALPPDLPAQEEGALSFPLLPAETAAGNGSTQPCLGDLEGTVRCGRFRVWENRQAKAGRTIDLAFVVADALDPEASGTMAATFFFGGPGSTVTEASSSLIRSNENLRRQRALLMLDFRGVGDSGALDCAVPYPGGVESRFGSLFPVDHIAACRDRLSQRAQLDQYTTAHNMDDLDELRAWLGFETLDLDGGSYGTREIQVFLRRHPASARTVILDAVSPLFTPGYVTHARGLQNALDELIAECLGNAACAKAYPGIERSLARVLERVRTDPPRVKAKDKGMDKTVPFGPGELGYALRGLLYGRGGDIPALIHAADKGEWQPLADYYLRRSGWVSEEGGVAGMHFSVLCAEDIVRETAESIARETAGTFLADYLIGGYARACEIWPHAKLDPSFWEPVKSDVPALLFSGTRDPVTPPSGGEAVASYLSNSLHIVVPGVGHGASGPCVGKLKRLFVETGSLEGLDTSCLGAMPPTEFSVSD